MKTAAEALADDSAYTQGVPARTRARDGVGYRGDTSMLCATGKSEERPNPFLGKSERATLGQMQSDSTKICNFCKGRIDGGIVGGSLRQLRISPGIPCQQMEVGQ